MYIRPYHCARTAVTALLLVSLLSGCATFTGQPTPAALGAGKHRSIKDDPEPATAVPAPKQAFPKTAAMAPKRPAQPAPLEPASPPACASGSDCMVRLKALIADPSRAWISQRPPATEYANGTRLFAYRALREKLTCPQISMALGEIDGAAAAFRSPVQGVSVAQANHLLSLNSEVGQELRTELKARCRT